MVKDEWAKRATVTMSYEMWNRIIKARGDLAAVSMTEAMRKLLDLGLKQIEDHRSRFDDNEL